MAQIAESFYLDANFKPITNLGLITKKTITFAGATTNAGVDDGGTLDGGVVFTVTGLVFCKHHSTIQRTPIISPGISCSSCKCNSLFGNQPEVRDGLVISIQVERFRDLSHKVIISLLNAF